MVIKYDIDIEKSAILNNISRITNQIFKLLPNREENGDWKSLLRNLIVEIGGMAELIQDQTALFSLLCKLEALNKMDGEDVFIDFRRTIFECLTLCTNIKKEYE